MRKRFLLFMSMVSALSSVVVLDVGYSGALNKNKTKGHITKNLREITVSIQANGQIHVLDLGETLPLLKGDRFKVSEFKRNNYTRVNIVGFVPDGDGNIRPHDGMKWVRFDDLNSKWAVSELKNKFQIEVYENNSLKGYVYVEYFSPEMKFVDLMLNGALIRWREGDVVDISSQDKFQVVKIESNIVEGEKRIDYRIVKDVVPSFIGVETENNANIYWELQFLHGKEVFSRIPMRVRGL